MIRGKKQIWITLLAFLLPFCAMASHSTNGLDGLKYVMMALLGAATVMLVNFILCLINLKKKNKTILVSTIIITALQAIGAFMIQNVGAACFTVLVICFLEAALIASAARKPVEVN